MKQSHFRTFFSFSKNQQRGIIALFFLLICSCLFLLFYDPSFTEEPNEEIRTQVLAFLAEQESKDENVKYKWKKGTKKMDLKLRTFDPNVESMDGFMSMGFSEKFAMNFINYRQKVKPFRKKKDVLGLYAVDQDLYDQLESYIDISPVKTNVSKGQIETKSRKSYSNKIFNTNKEKVDEPIVLSIDINRADTVELKKIKGIGSYYAKSIVKFRDALGGFHSVEQFNEIYAFQDRPEPILILTLNSFIDTSIISKINVNSSTKEEFAKHPYFKKHVANALFNYRYQNGPFDSIENIKKCHLVTDEIYLKIAPYLSLQ